MAFEKPIDEKIKKLADMLKANGLANSDSQALEMAMSMSSTANKVQKAYDNQKDEPDIGTTNTKQVISEITDSKTEVADEPVPDEIDASKIDAKDIYKQQEALIKNSFGGSNSEQTVQDIMDADAQEVYAAQFGGVPKKQSSSKEESESSQESNTLSETSSSLESDNSSEYRMNSSESVDRVDIEESESLSSQAESSQLNSQFDVQSDVSSDVQSDSQTNSSVEVESESQSEDERKKKIDDMVESKIDLSDVFNFGK